MPKASPGLEQRLPDYLYARLLRRAFPYHPVSQNEPLVNQLDDGEGSSPDLALAPARLADQTWLEFNDLPYNPVDKTRDAVS